MGPVRATRAPLPLLVCVLWLACSEAETPEPPPAGEIADPDPGPVEAPIVPVPSALPPPVEPGPPEAKAPGPPVVARPEPRQAPPPPPVPEPEPIASELDLDTLEQRLRDTDALGFLTKLALKNEIDDLVQDLDAFHNDARGQLPELRERFDLLVMKLMSLLQDDDPVLADEIAKAREPLWRLLADPREFAKISA